jgi:hypothetical protein
MALDVYFEDDIRNAIRAAYVAAEGQARLLDELLPCTGDDTPGALASSGSAASELCLAYRKGFLAALSAVATAFGLDISEREAPHYTIRDGSAGASATPAPRLVGPEVEVGPSDLDLVSFLWAKSQRQRRGH